MKIQNAEIGFVTFDALDVIATSTPAFSWAGKGMFATGAELKEYNDLESGLFEFKTSKNGAVGDKYGYGYRFDSESSEGVLTAAADMSSKAGEFLQHEKYGTTDYYRAVGVADIIAWITENNIH